HIWGWATWRRAWKQYDYSLEKFSEYPTNDLPPRFKKQIGQIMDGKLDTWDLQWVMTIWWTRGITIIPQLNLIKNIGYGAGKNATHTKTSPPGWMKRLKYGDLEPILHPSKIAVNQDADDFTLRTVYSDGTF